MNKFFSILAFAIVFLVAISCESCNGGGEGTETDTIANNSEFDEQKFFEGIDQSKVAQINAIVEGFTSPVEMAAMIKNNHIEFSKDYLVETSIADSYETNIKKAIGLGVLSADLGYLNIYQKTGQMVDYLVAINNIAGDLRVAQFFDFQTLKTLVTNGDNMDSLLFMTVSSFHQIDAYFTSSNRSFLTVLSVTGVWIESLYLLTQVAKDNEFKDFTTQIGTQKDLLTQLVEIVKVYKGHPQFDYILENLKNVQKAFDPVTITVQETEGRVEFIDGNYIIYPSEETVIDVPEGTLENIIKATETARNSIINIK
ncbi:MAG: hypothetical protein JXL97_09610 [Bacteroidales bacterium]|nr:hypothetical protein [Bacteroidales bacterium]